MVSLVFSKASPRFRRPSIEESDIRADVLMHKQGIAYPPSQEPLSDRLQADVKPWKQETMRTIYGEEARKSFES